MTAACPNPQRRGVVARAVVARPGLVVPFQPGEAVPPPGHADSGVADAVGARAVRVQLLVAHHLPGRVQLHPDRPAAAAAAIATASTGSPSRTADVLFVCSSARTVLCFGFQGKGT